MQQDDSAIVTAIKDASKQWQQAFNNGNAAQCAAQYETNATMHARPFGTFKGTEQIKDFWQNLINEGFNSVEYIEPQITVIDNQSAILSSQWKMNKAQGMIHKELWVLQADGTAKLREDDFEAIDG